MKQMKWILAACLIALFHPVIVARAQQNSPHLAYALPAGGRQGSSVQVRLGGQFLTGVTGVHFSGTGLQASVGEYQRPMNGGQAAKLRERLQELQKQTGDSAAEREILEIRLKLFVFSIERNAIPVLAESILLRIDIAPDARPGRRELRVATSQGLSNPIVFYVGCFEEFTETEVIKPAAATGMNQAQFIIPPTDIPITLPSTINGRIKPVASRIPARQGPPFTPGDVDRFRFHARKGQHLVVHALARGLIPYLADTVPGWFQSVISLLGPGGQKVAFEDDYRFDPDPVLHYRVQADGEYVLEIRDALFRGREDFVYRITIGELPFITSAFPLGGPAGTKTVVNLSGFNLRQQQVTMDLRGREAGNYPLVSDEGGPWSNSIPFTADVMTEVMEKEPNNESKHAQAIVVSIIINGKIDSPGDTDVYRFEGHAGDKIVAEVLARRLNSPLDSMLLLTDSTGRQWAANDDHEDKGSGLTTHHADSMFRVTLPQDGFYFLVLTDAQGKGGPEYGYRLRISGPRPDFDLRVVPSALNVRAGMNVAFSVYALRKDGFDGEIRLALPNAPPGFSLAGANMPAGVDHLRLTLLAPSNQQKEPVSLRLEGLAVILGKEVTRLALPADDQMQAFSYRHLVPAEEWLVSVLGRGAASARIRVLGDLPLRIPAGGTAELILALPPIWQSQKLQFELSEPPEGISILTTTPGAEGAKVLFQCGEVKAGRILKGNLILSASTPLPAAKSQPISTESQRRVQTAILPAIPFEVIPR